MPINLQDFEEFQDKDSERELTIINNCLDYANGTPGGLPGHQLMLIVAKLHKMLWSPSKKYLIEAIRETISDYEKHESDLGYLYDYLNWLEGKDGTDS